MTMPASLNISNISMYYDFEFQDKTNRFPPDSCIPPQELVSDELLNKLEMAIFIFLIGIFCVLGLVCNTIVILVFYKQGYKDTINITLSVIAVWDILICISGITYRTYVIMRPIIPEDMYIAYRRCMEIVAYVQMYLFNASFILGAHVAVERCLCVSLPFNIKSLLTPKVVACITISLSSLSVASKFLFLGLQAKIVWVFNPQINATIATFINPYPNLNKRLMNIYLRVSGFGVSSISLAIQIVCFFVISYHLHKSGKFRSQISNSTKDNAKNGMGHRDIQVTRMLLVVIFFFIISFLPAAVYDLANIVLPKFNNRSEFRNFFNLSLFIISALGQMNCVTSCFIYYFMSSKFKKSLRKLFGLGDKKLSFE